MVAVKLNNNVVTDYIENCTELPNGFDELWTDEEWNEYTLFNRKVAVLLVENQVIRFKILDFALIVDLPENYTLWNLDEWNQYVQDNTQPQVISAEEKLLKDIDFGKNLIKDFLKENRELDREFTMEDNLMLLNKFSPIETLSRLGDIKTVLLMVQDVEIDEIFTQERKDSFITKINDYLT